MSRMSNKIIRTAELTAVLAVAAVSNASAQDLRSPDAQDGARGAEISRTLDLRSPDAQDAAREAEIGSTHPSLNSSDDSSGFGSADAVIAGAGISLLLVALGGAVLFTRRSRKPRIPVVSS